MAEREGFEPPVRDANNSFRGYRLQPLGHLSYWYGAKVRAGLWLNVNRKTWFSVHSRIEHTACGLRSGHLSQVQLCNGAKVRVGLWLGATGKTSFSRCSRIEHTALGPRSGHLSQVRL